MGGNRPNQQCMFPFIYDGTSYDECTTTDNNGIPWCSTKISPAGDFLAGEWGNCGIDCPGNLGKYYKIYSNKCFLFLIILPSIL